jgi:hypothetical protein
MQIGYMEDVDFLAKGLLDGSISCEGCTGLKELVDKVKSGEMNLDEFKNILKASKEEMLGKVI